MSIVQNPTVPLRSFQDIYSKWDETDLNRLKQKVLSCVSNVFMTLGALAILKIGFKGIQIAAGLLFNYSILFYIFLIGAFVLGELMEVTYQLAPRITSYIKKEFSKFHIFETIDKLKQNLFPQNTTEGATNETFLNRPSSETNVGNE